MLATPASDDTKTNRRVNTEKTTCENSSKLNLSQTLGIFFEASESEYFLLDWSLVNAMGSLSDEFWLVE